MLIIPLLQAGAGLYGLRKVLRQKPRNPSDPESKVRSITDQLERDAAGFSESGSRLSGAYDEGIMSFDPREAYQEYARGAAAESEGVLGERLKAMQAGAGNRLDTGFYDIDRGDVIRNVRADLSNRLAQGALQASGQRLGQLEGMGALGLRRGELGAEIRAGSADRYQAMANVEEQRRRRRRSGIAGLLGTAAGAVIGSAVPGIGTAIGAGIGSKLGDIF